MRKPALTIFILSFLAITLALVRVFIANNVATSGIILSQVQKELNMYKLENSEISTKLYSMSSLTYINTKAQDLGYQEGSPVFVLTNQRSVALKQ